MKKLLLFTLFLFFIFFFNFFLHAQSTEPKLDWDHHFGGGRGESLYKIIQTKRGGYAAVGQTRTNSEGGEDMYLLTISANGNLETARPIGNKKDEIAYSLVQAHDGGFVLVGTTESPNKEAHGGFDAFMLKTDERGVTLWRRYFGTSGNDEFRDIIQDKQGNFLVTGQKNKHLWYAKMDANGELLWEHDSRHTNFSMGNALTLTKNEDLLISGFVAKSDNPNEADALLLKISSAGSLIFENKYQEKGIIKGLDVIELSNGDYAMACLAFSREYREDAALLVTNATGITKFARPYGGKFDDAAFTLIEDTDKGILLAGRTKSHIRDARRDDGFLIKLSPTNGDRLWKLKGDNDDPHYGRGETDVFFDALLSHDGSLVLAGFTNIVLESGKAKGDDAWIMKLMPTSLAQKTEPNAIKTTQPIFVDGNRNGELNPNERGYTSFEVTNQSKSGVASSRTEIVATDSVEGLKYYRSVIIPYLKAGETQIVTIPMTADDYLVPGRIAYDITLLDVNKAVLKTITQENEANRLVSQLDMVCYKFTTPNNSLPKKGQPITLSIDLKNTGNLKAERVFFTFGYERNVYALDANGKEDYGASNKVKNVGIIEPNETKTLSLTFKVDPVFIGNQFVIKCFGQDSENARHQLGAYSLTFDTPIPTPICAPPPPPSAKNFVRLTWNTKGPLQTDSSGYSLTLDLESDKTISNEQLTIFANGVLINNLEENALKSTKYTGIKYHTYRYALRVPLQKGSNKIEVEVENAVGKKRSEPLEIVYTPYVTTTTNNSSTNVASGSIKPNLFVLAIGVPLVEDKLQFTSKDANDFAGLWNATMRNSFEKITIIKATTFDETNYGSVIPKLKALKEKVINGEIKPTDMVLIFVSSQAKSVPNQLLIKMRDFDGIAPNLTTIDYNVLMKRYIEPVHQSCPQTMLFLDIFHYSENSESKDKENESTESEIFQLSSNFEAFSSKYQTPVVVSCKAGEASYEHADWQNGAFTKGLKIAFSSNVPDMDKNQNKEIEFEEFYTYLQSNVSNLASSKNKKWQQTPVVTVSKEKWWSKWLK
ncbi:MAG: hypothetical protein RLZZ292_1232 [Bacteroidota bacterium]|jgi:hypothetical protein